MCDVCVRLEWRVTPEKVLTLPLDWKKCQIYIGKRAGKIHVCRIIRHVSKILKPANEAKSCFYAHDCESGLLCPLVYMSPRFWTDLSLFYHANILTIRKEGKSTSTKWTEYYYWFQVLYDFISNDANKRNKRWGKTVRKIRKRFTC